jgi:hypothetical protein
MILKEGGLYQTRHGAILEAMPEEGARRRFFFSGVILRVIRPAPEIIVLNEEWDPECDDEDDRESRYDFERGKRWRYNKDGRFSSRCDEDDFQGHLVREIKP